MTPLNDQELMEIIEGSGPDGAYADAELLLRNADRADLADALVKLQQDAGLEFDPTFDPDDRSNPPGPQTEALWKAYEPVTRERYAAIRQQLAAFFLHGGREDRPVPAR